MPRDPTTFTVGLTAAVKFEACGHRVPLSEPLDASKVDDVVHADATLPGMCPRCSGETGDDGGETVAAE